MDSLKAQLKFLPTNSSSNFIVISPSTFNHPSVSKIAVFASSDSQSYTQMAVGADPPNRAGHAQLQTALPRLFPTSCCCRSAPTHQPELFSFGLMRFLQVPVAFVQQIRPILVLLKLHPPSAH